MKRAGSSRFVYQFADNNPYVGHPNPLKEGQDLFRRGLLSEAVLALEAEVLKNPENAEGWRLLGITHAENDDDRQVCRNSCVLDGLFQKSVVFLQRANMKHVDCYNVVF